LLGFLEANDDHTSQVFTAKVAPHTKFGFSTDLHY
jgi:hypothetical protein